jgi:hypothetical protein
MNAGQSTTYRDVCYAVFRDQELPHPAAPKLLQAVARAGYSSSGVAELDADLSSEDGAWLQSKLREIGFEEEEGSLRADPELVQLLVKEQNSARKQVHKEAAAMREGMLDELLRDASSSEPPRPSKRARTDIGGAREALEAFCTGEAAREVARGPVLLGVAALLRAQGAHPSELQAWACERAVLLNGGDGMLTEAVALLRTLALQPSVKADVEAADGLLRWVVHSGAWSVGELRTLAVLAERRGRRLAAGVAASGRVEADSGRPFSPHQHATWQAWLHSLIISSLARLAG